MDKKHVLCSLLLCFSFVTQDSSDGEVLVWYLRSTYLSVYYQTFFEISLCQFSVEVHPCFPWTVRFMWYFDRISLATFTAFSAVSLMLVRWVCVVFWSLYRDKNRRSESVIRHNGNPYLMDSAKSFLMDDHFAVLWGCWRRGGSVQVVEYAAT